ncbi:trp operon repressor [Chlamydia trachomatis]|uniref:Trp operon repressor homolog n=4 Tax=Chlamydia trachomatis TaxID=813 RepID=TRPR_CHLTR|nr:trp operon repressor [Chlamydia trachomatis]NP_219672.1 Trp operon repressor [Chlamydia trachomatis D/UW-3/CX]O84171.1 RecName: Full=Trp operon repressor homolog [Chlamydia trachomatis D/UW-3/CX]Q3KMJ6.1 RecName: Full=Trp operon repressor homolog [Chlamydia trachomatis A/HAR-13]AAC67760.1 Trp Operon Repressor [Chlamydia trachomatis D/UW-3/CX]AAM19164.1 tryptophan repressor [Chlamydia trachomatis]AAM19167.1 tryptophan repressor [Chlamydia trachomatis]AAM19170.1 tryptophan repressor [Chlamy
MKNQEESGWQAFLTLCSKMQKEKFLQDLFSLFLSFSERKDVASRYHIIRALLEGELTQREIAEKYGVSIAQITRGSNALKGLDPQFKEFLQKEI